MLESCRSVKNVNKLSLVKSVYEKKCENECCMHVVPKEIKKITIKKAGFHDFFSFFSFYNLNTIDKRHLFYSSQSKKKNTKKTMGTHLPTWGQTPFFVVTKQKKITGHDKHLVSPSKWNHSGVTTHRHTHTHTPGETIPGRYLFENILKKKI